MHVLHANKTRVAMVTLVAIQLIVMILFSMQKIGYHMDEILSYGLANSYFDPFITSEEQYGMEWYTSEELQDYLTVDNQDRFSYDSVVYNQEQDVHPPLWYALFHTINSCFFVGVFSKWSGIILNLICFICIDIVLYFFAKQISSSRAIAVLSVLIWGFSLGAINMVTFIRMYALLTLWTILFVYLHSCLLNHATIQSGKISSKLLLGLIVVTILGILTQYYFLIFTFFICGLWCVYLLWKKKWKILIQYSCGELFAVIFCVIVFPAMIKHIFSGYRGEAAFSALAESEAWTEHLKTYLSIFSHSIVWGCLKLLSILAILFLIYWVIQNFFMKFEVHYNNQSHELKVTGRRCDSIKLQWALPSQCAFYIIVATACIAYFLMITRIAPYQADRYIMPLFPIVAVYMANMLCWIGKRYFPKRGMAIIIALCVVLSCISWKVGPYNYLFLDNAARNEITAQYEDLPVIVLYSARWKGTVFADELAEHPAVFFCEADNLTNLEEKLHEQDISNGFLLYTESDDDQAIKNFMELFADGIELEKMTNVRGNIYLVEGA